MKRAGFLMERIADTDNLYRALYLSCRRRSRKKYAREIMGRDNYQYVQELRQQFLEGRLNMGSYHYFTVYEPKERVIYAAAFRERIVQHALMRICAPYFERYQMFCSYACRKNMGQYKALEQAIEYHRNSKYFLKMDVRKYFDNIDHMIIKALLRRLFKDKSVLAVFDEIIDGYSSSPMDTNRGIPIGNLCSQHFANHYLGIADHFVKEKLQVKKYVRYMDDMVMWGNNKAELLSRGNALKDFLQDSLHLELKPFCLNKTVEGLPFLGYRVMKNRLRLIKKSKLRYIQKVNKYNNMLLSGEFNLADYNMRINCLTAFVKKADAAGFMNKVKIISI